MAKNEITGDEIKSRTASLDYLEGWDRIFGQANLGRYPPTPDKPMESPTTKETDESTN